MANQKEVLKCDTCKQETNHKLSHRGDRVVMGCDICGTENKNVKHNK